MTSAHDHAAPVRFPILQGVLPITAARIPAEVLAGITLAAIAVPEVMGYTKISGTTVFEIARSSKTSLSVDRSSRLRSRKSAAETFQAGILVAVRDHPMSISSGAPYKVQWKKNKLGGVCSAFLVLVVTAGISSQVPPPVSDLPPDQQVLAFLTESVDWYRHRAIEERLPTEPADLVFLEDNRPIAAQILQLSFDFARAHASLAATFQTSNQKASAAIASGSSPDLAHFVQLENNADLASRQASQEIETIKKKLATAHGAERQTLQAALDVAQSRLDLLQAEAASLRALVDFVQATGARQTDLASSIDDLARTVPEMTSPTTVRAQPQNYDVASLAKLRDSGILGLSSEVSVLGRKLRVLDDEIGRTDTLRRSSDDLRKPLLAYVNKRFPVGGNNYLRSSDLRVLQQQKAELDALMPVAKTLAPAMVALDKQNVLIAAYTSQLKKWRATVVKENEKTWRNLILLLVVVAVVITALLLMGAAARRFTDLHIREPERRHVIRVILRVVPWVLIVLVAAFSFTSDLASLATFFGLLTAGVAIALQSVIVSALGYFMLVGRRGIKVGDRVEISGVTGHVTHISWLQFQVQEIDKKTQQPTGQAVTFPNSLVLSSGGLGKFNQGGLEPAQLEVSGKSSRL